MMEIETKNLKKPEKHLLIKLEQNKSLFFNSEIFIRSIQRLIFLGYIGFGGDFAAE